MNYERSKIVIAVIVMVCLSGVAGCGTGNSEELQLIQQINISGTITNSQAERLSKVKFLDLEGLTTITDKQVESLSNVSVLGLRGLTSMTDEQAESLSKVKYMGVSNALQPLIDKYKKQ